MTIPELSPRSSLGLPPIAAAASPTAGLAEASGAIKTAGQYTLISQGREISRLRAPGASGVGGQARERGNRPHSPEWRKDVKLARNEGLRLQTGGVRRQSVFHP